MKKIKLPTKQQIRQLWKKFNRKYAYSSTITLTVCGIFMVMMFVITMMILIDAPKEKHFGLPEDENVWFGDGWYYSDEYGNRINAGNEVAIRSESYIQVKSDSGDLCISKELDFTPKVYDWFIFRARTELVSINVNGANVFNRGIHDKSDYYSIRMYMLHQIPAGEFREGDIITIRLYNPSQRIFNVQFLAIGDRYALEKYVMKGDLTNLVICFMAFLLLIVIAVVGRSTILTGMKTGVESLHWLSAFLISAMFYIAFDTGYIELISGRPALVYWMKSMSLLSVPIPFIMYTKMAFFPGHRRYELLASVNFVVILSSVAAFVANSYNITRSYKYIHIIIVIGIIMCLMSFIQERYIPEAEVILGYFSVFFMSMLSVWAYWDNRIFPASMPFGYGLVSYSFFMFVWTIRSSNVMKKEREAVDKALMQREKKAAEVANEQKTRFLSHMSHEIRTPLNAVLGMNELILKKSSDAEILHYSYNIKRAGNTLLAIINDVLDFSKIETGKMDIVNADYSLSCMLYDILVMTKERAENKGLELRINIDSTLPDCLYGDETRIKQIVLNLLSNAVKYTKSGWIELYVSLESDSSLNSTALKGSYVKNADIKNSDTKNTDTKNTETKNTDTGEKNIRLIIRVSDSGIGIRKEDISVLFKEFERLDRLKNRSIEGTGLGLSITQKLIALMKGRIKVESEYGKGSTFEVVVPQKAPYDESGSKCRDMLQRMEPDLMNPNDKARNISDNDENIHADKDNTGVINNTDNTENNIINAAGDNIDSDNGNNKITNNEALNQNKNEGLADKAGETDTPCFDNKRVLVIDDNELNLEVLVSILSMLGIDVTKAFNGIEALEISKHTRFDLILSDDMMPELNGTELMQIIKNDSGNKNFKTPIVVLTANAIEGARTEYMQKGFDEYLTKPIDIDALQAILLKYMAEQASEKDG